MTLPSSPFSKLKNKTGKIKDWYSPQFVKIFCDVVNPSGELFDNQSFLKEFKKTYSSLELTGRLNLISDIFDGCVEMSYEGKLKVLTNLFGEPLPYEKGMFTYGFPLYPTSKFVEKHGAKNLKASFDFIEEMTTRFTGEAAIRPLATADEKKTLAQMKKWSKQENFHIRRLASEGLRARLPWAKQVAWINKSPQKTLPIYNRLRNDPSLYVRRSVANSMGDMIKINEDLAFETFQKWLGKKKTKENLWVISHAIRHPVKKNNKRFISLKNQLRL